MNKEEKENDFHVEVRWTGERTLADVDIENQETIRTGRPADPDEQRLYLPEELFVASGAVCFMNSFVYFTKKMHISFKSFKVESAGKLEKVDRSFEITEIHSKSKVVIESEDLKKKIERALELGAKYCFVANSMKCPTYHEHEIIVET